LSIKTHLLAVYRFSSDVWSMTMITSIFLLLSLLVQQTHADPNDWVCSKETPARCDHLAQTARAQQNFGVAYDLDKAGCEFNDEQSCSELASDSSHLSSEQYEATKALIAEKCLKNDAFCGVLADLYYSENDYGKALPIDRKYFLKYFRGAFPIETYKAGHIEEAFKTAKMACDRDHESCIFYVRNMADHPQINEFISASEKLCRSSDGASAGATGCVILGTYFYANGNHSKAVDLWNVECRQSVTEDCLLILGSDAKPTEKLKAFQKMCGAPKLYSDYMSARATYCKNPPDQVPKELIKWSEGELASYIQVQSKPKDKSGIQKNLKNSCAAELEEKMKSIHSHLPNLQYSENQSACFTLADEINDFVGFSSQCEKIKVSVKAPSVQSILEFTDHQKIVALSKIKTVSVEQLMDWLGTKVGAMTYGKCRAKFRNNSP
jgi:hypothetical protein